VGNHYRVTGSSVGYRDAEILALFLQGRVARQLLHRVNRSDVILAESLVETNTMKHPGTLIAIAFLISAMEVFPGCTSEHTKTVQSTTTTSTPAQHQTTTETTKPQEHDSVLGATAHAVGTVILFPFRLIGDALMLIA